MSETDKLLPDAARKDPMSAFQRIWANQALDGDYHIVEYCIESWKERYKEYKPPRTRQTISDYKTRIRMLEYALQQAFEFIPKSPLSRRVASIIRSIR